MAQSVDSSHQAVGKVKTRRKSVASSGRIEIRIDEKLKRELENTAALQGVSLSAFVISTVLEASRKIQKNHNNVVLEAYEREAFIQLLLNPPAPSPELKKTLAAQVIL